MAAEANRDLAKLNLSYTRVTAPFDGRIDRRLGGPRQPGGRRRIYSPGLGQSD